MSPKLDEKDIAILHILQRDCKLTAREVADKVDAPITTVFAKIKRMEQLGIIKEYRAVLDAKKLDFGVTAFILASFSYRDEKGGEALSQRFIAEQIAKFPEVQEVHIISGDWDILIKVKDRNVDSVGRFVVDKLRTVKGIEKTLTCIAFDSPKETTILPLAVKKPIKD